MQLLGSGAITTLCHTGAWSHTLAFYTADFHMICH